MTVDNVKSDFYSELRVARSNFKLLSVYLEEVIYSGAIVLEANSAARRINGTIEANVLEVTRYSMRKNAILSLRKMFEKSSSDKKSNIDYLVGFLNKNKKELSQAYYKAVYKENAKTRHAEVVDKDTKMIRTVRLKVDERKKMRIKHAEDMQKLYGKDLDSVVKDWKSYFIMQNVKRLTDNRTVLAHSMAMDEAVKFEGLSFDSMNEYLNIAEGFVNRIDMLLNRNQTLYDSFRTSWNDAAKKFWERLV